MTRLSGKLKQSQLGRVMLNGMLQGCDEFSKKLSRYWREWIPIWCAVATYTLISIIKKELKLDASLYSLLQVLSVSVFEMIELQCSFAKDGPQIEDGWICKPLPQLDI
jgi:hypothetical protein